MEIVNPWLRGAKHNSAPATLNFCRINPEERSIIKSMYIEAVSNEISRSNKDLSIFGAN